MTHTSNDPVTTRRPRVDLLEHDDRYVLLVDAPGADTGEIDVRFEAGVLSVDAPRTAGRESYDRQEYATDGWRVRYRFGDLVDGEGIEARYEAGILSVRLDKARTHQARRIDVHCN